MEYLIGTGLALIVGLMIPLTAALWLARRYLPVGAPGGGEVDRAGARLDWGGLVLVTRADEHRVQGVFFFVSLKNAAWVTTLACALSPFHTGTVATGLPASNRRTASQACQPQFSSFWLSEARASREAVPSTTDSSRRLSPGSSRTAPSRVNSLNAPKASPRASRATALRNAGSFWRRISVR